MLCSLEDELNLSAEERFRQAFYRLCADKPLRLQKGSAVSQNNVAKEAGTGPSALKKQRYPSLCSEIQAKVAEYDKSKPKTKNQELVSARSKNNDLLKELLLVKEDRDYQISLKLYAQHMVLALTKELDELKNATANKITPIRKFTKPSISPV
jgi:hypothetical protein